MSNRRNILYSICVSALALSACGNAKNAVAPNANAQNEVPVSVSDTFTAQNVSATVIIADRNVIGTATVHEAREGVLLQLDLKGLPPGWHGMHYHVKADCGDTAFKNSGGHINPSGRKHGMMNPEGPDNADMPNIYVHADGTVKAEVYSDRVSLSGRGDRPSLLDADGSALVIHANQDDHLSQPIGGAGGRIACATLTSG